MLAAALLSASFAQAQLGVGQFSSVRGGFFFPTNGGSKTGFAFGVDSRFVGLKIPVLGVGTSIEGSIDYVSAGSNHNIPVLIGARVGAGQTSFGVGAGVGFSHVGNGDSVDYNMAFSVRQGLSTGPLPLYLEGRYYYSSRASVRGFAVMVGLRF